MMHLQGQSWTCSLFIGGVRSVKTPDMLCFCRVQSLYSLSSADLLNTFTHSLVYTCCVAHHYTRSPTHASPTLPSSQKSTFSDFSSFASTWFFSWNQCPWPCFNYDLVSLMYWFQSLLSFHFPHIFLYYTSSPAGKNITLEAALVYLTCFSQTPHSIHSLWTPRCQLLWVFFSFIQGCIFL